MVSEINSRSTLLVKMNKGKSTVLISVLLWEESIGHGWIGHGWTPFTKASDAQEHPFVSRMKCCEQITFQMLTLLQRYLFRQSQYSISKSLALIAEMVRAFGMDLKVEGSSPLRSRYFLSQNFDNFTRISVCESKMNAGARAQLTF